MDNLIMMKDIKDKDKEIKELKSIILELYTIIKAAEDEDNIKIINLTYGTITILLKQILDLE